MSSSSRVAAPLESFKKFLKIFEETGPHPILWVGAGASAGAGVPTLAEIVKELKKSLSTDVGSEPFVVIEAFVGEFAETALHVVLERLIAQPKRPTDLHSAIARLADAGTFPVLFTTNYDHLLEIVLHHEGVVHRVQILEAGYKLMNMDVVQVLKLHGDLVKWEEAVLTSASHKNFEENWPLLKKQLNQSLRTRPIVFVGCSMLDPRLLDWLQEIGADGRRGLLASRAIMPERSWGKVPPDVRDLLTSANIRPIVVPDYEAVTELFCGLETPTKHPATRPSAAHPATQADSPLVSSSRSAANVVTLTLLHFSDLHWGHEATADRWSNINLALQKDLEKLHRRIKTPWDLVIFTGDLVQKADAALYLQLNCKLQDIWKSLENIIGQKPPLVVVPGNHDLKWPDHKDDHVHCLLQYHNQERIQARLREENSPYKEIIQSAFAAYVDWTKTSKIPKLQNSIQEGKLPGDFSAVYEKDGVRFGFVGLNSAFLQLASASHAVNPKYQEEPFKEKLALELWQFHAACGGDGPTFTDRNCNMAFLLTHHPPDWLAPTYLEDFQHEISTVSPVNRFAVHFFGHMHTTYSESISVAGAPNRNSIQGPSLFGYATFGQNKKERSHGYIAMQVEIDMNANPPSATYRLWPREAERSKGGGWFFRDASGYMYDNDKDDGGTEPKAMGFRVL